MKEFLVQKRECLGGLHGIFITPFGESQEIHQGKDLFRLCKEVCDQYGFGSYYVNMIANLPVGEIEKIYV